MGVIKALIKIIIITVQIGILLRLVIPLATALPIEDVSPNPGDTNRQTEIKAEDRMFMPPKFPYSAPFGYSSSGLLCLFTDTPYVGGWFGRSCQGPIPPFVLPTPPSANSNETADPLRVPGTMNYLEGYYGYPWMTPSPPTSSTLPPQFNQTAPNGTVTAGPPTPESTTITAIRAQGQPMLPNGVYYNNPLFTNMQNLPWVTPPPPSTVRPPVRPRPRPSTTTTSGTTSTTPTTTTARMSSSSTTTSGWSFPGFQNSFYTYPFFSFPTFPWDAQPPDSEGSNGTETTVPSTLEPPTFSAFRGQGQPMFPNGDNFPNPHFPNMQNFGNYGWGRPHRPAIGRPPMRPRPRPRPITTTPSGTTSTTTSASTASTTLQSSTTPSTTTAGSPTTSTSGWSFPTFPPFPSYPSYYSYPYFSFPSFSWDAPTPPTDPDSTKSNGTETTSLPTSESTSNPAIRGQSLFPTWPGFDNPFFANMQNFGWTTPQPRPSTDSPPIRSSPRPPTAIDASSSSSTFSTPTTTPTITTSRISFSSPSTSNTGWSAPSSFYNTYYSNPFFAFPSYFPVMPGFYQERPHNPDQYADYGEPVEGNPWEPDDEELFIENYGIRASNPNFKLGDPHQKRKIKPSG